MKRIDSPKPDTQVTLKFCAEMQGRGAEYVETAVFKGVTGEGDERRATFESMDGSRVYEWDAYRFNGHWAYGSSAETLRLVAVGE